jgi:hypothetical protein
MESTNWVLGFTNMWFIIVFKLWKINKNFLKLDMNLITLIFQFVQCLLIIISVTCAVGPNVHTLKAQTNFPSKPNFCNFVKFWQQNPLKNQYLPHLRSNNCEINSIKSELSKAFPQHQEDPKFKCSF